MKVNQPEYISYTQLFILIHFFEIGSTVVVGVGDEAKQDAWIAVLLASFIGVGLMFVYVKILTLSSQSSLYHAFSSLMGTKISNCVIFIYMLYFIYIAARVLRDFTELVNTAIYPHTPIEFVAILFVITVMYYLYHGLEVSARSLFVFMPYIASFLFLIVVFLWMNGSIDMNKIRPIFFNGPKPILAAVYPELMTFPYGETVVFLCLMSYIQQKGKLLIVNAAAVIVSGIVLSFFTFIKLAVLGVNHSSKASFPLLSAIRTISIAHFLERLDALGVFVMLIGIFIKVLLFTLAALKGMEAISSIPYRFFILPFGGILSVLSMIIADNYAEHLQEGLQFVPYYVHLPLQYGIPVLLLIGLWTKQKLGGKRSEAG
ncbi:GerAB/ArcD/ProY family transporter [Bacillus songklensis]|uniref:GerAB/ArcD/ProY family transporter n=1 Tax=Bacillus songklensis TaxID=1069116 RepID=A0ABV8BAP8_9BACI